MIDNLEFLSSGRPFWPVSFWQTEDNAGKISAIISMIKTAISAFIIPTITATK
jgi:hypothetical protein